MTVDLKRHEMLALARTSLGVLRAALLRDAPEGQAAAAFQEAGYVAGAGVFDAFSDWLSSRGDGTPDSLDHDTFQARAAEFFRDTGWGSIELAPIADSVLALDAADWSEADPSLGAAHPSCFYSSGMFADFFSRIGGEPLGAFEVECRSSGAPRCRFLLGSPDTLNHVYNRMVEGAGYEEALQ
jgi:predicted hydrocarbon binding protein